MPTPLDFSDTSSNFASGEPWEGACHIPSGQVSGKTHENTFGSPVGFQDRNGAGVVDQIEFDISAATKQLPVPLLSVK